MSVITSKTIEPNENVHYFVKNMIEFYAVRMGILDIAAGFRKIYSIDKSST